MTAEKTFKMDEREIPFEEGDTIMDAALRAGVYIPHLCHNPEFEPNGSCRVCTVGTGERQVAACTTPATEGMEVDNSSAGLTARRRALVQMLFVEGNHVCPG
ncbi:MAG: 2Fe-2S iron-sulfur cluster-binding protein, partial [Chromatiales bacterium]